MATDDLAELKRIAAAIIADDTTLTADSKQALEELLEALFKWVYDMRAAPNLTKYQLWCSEGARATSALMAKHIVCMSALQVWWKQRER